MDTILQDAMDSGAGPKYRRLVDGLTHAIATGELAPGEKLPPVRELSWRLGVTPGTVARAFSLLADAGRVRSEVGRGTFVCDPADEIAPARAAVRASDLTAPLLPQLPAGDDVLFAPRLPDVGQLRLVRESLVAAAQMPTEDLLDYPVFGAQEKLRAAVMPWLPEDIRASAESEQVGLTAGGQNAIMIVMQALLTAENPVILVEQLTYPGVRRAAEALRAQLVAVEMDDHGAVPEALDEAARRSGARVFFTMPEAQNPTCVVAPQKRRLALAEVAARRGLHVVQDDCYRIAPPEGSSYRALLPELGWYISSLSKALSPALRVGYAVAPAPEAMRLRRIIDANYFGLSSPMAAASEYLLRHPDTPGYIAAMRERMRAYVEVAVNVLGRFDIAWRHDLPYVWLRLPAGWREAAFVQALADQGIRVRAGDDFVARDARAVHAVRISVNGRMSLEHFSDVLGRLAALLDRPPEQAGV